ncbi:MAG: hypothetical protein QXU40_03230, partial [Candidatus Pacearchaeota archaeon]
GFVFRTLKADRSYYIVEMMDLFIFIGNLLLFPVFLVFWYIINVAEAVHYPNYVFSTFHIQPQNFSNVILLSGFIIFIQFYPLLMKKYFVGEKKIKKYFLEQNYIFTKERIFWPSNRALFLKDFIFKKILSANFVDFFVMLIIVILIVLYSYQNSMVAIIGALRGTAFILQHIKMSDQEKMRYTWGSLFYDYMNFIKNNTPEDATIVIPPQEGPWLSTGNAGLVRYFLYPRFVINGGYDYLPNKKFDYVLLAKGEWLTDKPYLYGWPKVSLNAEKIIYFNPETFEATESATNYDPLDPKHKNSWGIIKVKGSR